MIEFQPQTPEESQATTVGMMMAVRDALTVLIRQHPSLSKVADMLYKEREATMALMLGGGYPDKMIEAYRDTIDSIRPHRDGDDMNPP